MKVLEEVKKITTVVFATHRASVLPWVDVIVDL